MKTSFPGPKELDSSQLPRVSNIARNKTRVISEHLIRVNAVQTMGERPAGKVSDFCMLISGFGYFAQGSRSESFLVESLGVHCCFCLSAYMFAYVYMHIYV